jgi:predicted tellurium resistance membrane protein TerC
MKRTLRKPVLSVTSVPISPEDERNQRFVKYLIAMVIRLVCLALAVLTTGPIQWIGFAGAIFLPYFAVVLANSAGSRSSSAEVPIVTVPQIEQAPKTNKEEAALSS